MVVIVLNNTMVVFSVFLTYFAPPSSSLKGRKITMTTYDNSVRRIINHVLICTCRHACIWTTAHGVHTGKLERREPQKSYLIE